MLVRSQPRQVYIMELELLKNRLEKDRLVSEEAGKGNPICGMTSDLLLIQNKLGLYDIDLGRDEDNDDEFSPF